MSKRFSTQVSNDEFSEIVSRAAQHGRCIAMRLAGMGRFTSLILYYREGTENSSGELKLFRSGDEVPDGWKMADSSPMKGDIPYDNYGIWIRERSMRLPVLKRQKAA